MVRLIPCETVVVIVIHGFSVVVHSASSAPRSCELGFGVISEISVGGEAQRWLLPSQSSTTQLIKDDDGKADANDVIISCRAASRWVV